MLQFSLGATLLEGGTRDDRWDRFGRYALAWPNDVHVGTPAVPPNGGLGMPPETQSWDYANHSTVMSAADDWLADPALTGVNEPIDCTVWGWSGDGLQAWYAAHLPHTAGGVLDRDCNTWWKYVADVDGTLRRCTRDACGPAYATGWPCAVDDQCASRHCSCQGSHMLCSEG